MLLVIDIGNTHTVLGVYTQTTLLRHFRIHSDRRKTADEYAVLLANLIVEPLAVKQSVVASVVPPLTDAICDAVATAFDVQARRIESTQDLGMPVLYSPRHEIGADRLVNAIAAYAQTKQRSIVVDFGTATTFDCISAKGEYVGGVIAPGLGISAEALFTHAAKLPPVEIRTPPQAIGDSTTHAMQSGIVFGYVGLVEGLVRRLRQELGEPCRVIATGGFAQEIAAHTRMVDQVNEHLTLSGLRLLATRL